MRSEYDPSQPIKVFFHQIEIAVEFAETGNRPYEATKNRTSNEFTRAYTKSHGRLLSHVLKPTTP